MNATSTILNRRYAAFAPGAWGAAHVERRAFDRDIVAAEPLPRRSDDLRAFLTAFLGGLVFFSVLIF